MLAQSAPTDSNNPTSPVSWEQVLRTYYNQLIELDPRVDLSDNISLRNAVNYDPSLRKVVGPLLELLEQCQVADDGIARECPSELLDQDTLLRQLGFESDVSSGPSQQWCLPNYRIAEILKVKDASRREFHRINGIVRYVSYSAIVEHTRIRTRSSASWVPVERRTEEEVTKDYDTVIQFARKYRHVAATDIIINSFQMLLREQLEQSDHAIGWTVTDSSIVERGTVEFVDEFVHIIIDCFGCQVDTAQTEQVGHGDYHTGSHTFIIDSALSNVRIRYLLTALGNFKNDSPTTGSTIDASFLTGAQLVKRTNVNGELDNFKPSWWTVMLLQYCGVLIQWKSFFDGVRGFVRLVGSSSQGQA